MQGSFKRIIEGMKDEETRIRQEIVKMKEIIEDNLSQKAFAQQQATENKLNSSLENTTSKIQTAKDDLSNFFNSQIDVIAEEKKKEEEQSEKIALKEKKEREQRIEKEKEVLKNMVLNISTDREKEKEELNALQESMATAGALIFKELADMSTIIKKEWNNKSAEREKDELQASEIRNQNINVIISTFKSETEAAARLSDIVKNKKESELQEEERERNAMKLEENLLREMKLVEILHAEKLERENRILYLKSLTMEMQDLIRQFKNEYNYNKVKDRTWFLKTLASQTNEVETIKLRINIERENEILEERKLKNELNNQITEVKEIKNNFYSEREKEIIEFGKLKQGILNDHKGLVRVMEELEKSKLLITNENTKRREDDKIREETLAGK